MVTIFNEFELDESVFVHDMFAVPSNYFVGTWREHESRQRRIRVDDRMPER